MRFLVYLFAVTGGVASLGSRSAGPRLISERIAIADTSEPWLRYFTGSWHCMGGFPSGRTLAATVTFAPDLSGKWLQYRHADVAPGTYQVAALWGHQGKESGLIAAFHDNGGGMRMYRSAPWADGALVFVKDTAFRAAATPAGNPDRFTYRRVTDSTFWFGWEVSRSPGAWAVGDSLTCRRGA